MITAAQLAQFRTASIDFEDTERLKAELNRLKSERRPLYLTEDEFGRILQWKLRGQYGRQARYRNANTDEVIRGVTGLALNLTHPEKDYELELRMGILCSLRGVGVPVASAVLALVYPEQYAVIDFRVWRQFFPGRTPLFTIKEYRQYMTEIRRLAAELGWTVQEVDLAIWEYDRRHGVDSQTAQGRGRCT